LEVIIIAKSYGSLYEKILSWDNLVEAYDLARKNKKNRLDVISYHNHALDNLVFLKKQLDSELWEPASYKQFTIYNETKRRDIEAPLFRDRIVQHAIHKVLEPLYEKKFIYDSYSCRKGKGTHAAVKKVRSYLIDAKRKWGDNVYVLKCDISKFFPSIDHKILMNILSKTVRQKNLLNLIYKATINPNKRKLGKGIPIGALTSQLFANVYLNSLDHYIKEKLKCVYYVRYADDFLLLSNSKKHLQFFIIYIKRFLTTLNLKLNPKTTIFPISQGVDFCGYRLWCFHILPRKRVVKSGKKLVISSLKNYEKNLISKQKIISVWNSFKAYLSHSNSFTILYNFNIFLFLFFEKFLYDYKI